MDCRGHPPASFVYSFTVTPRALHFVISSCADALAWGDSVCVPHADGFARLWESFEARNHVMHPDDCRLVAADMAAVARAVLPGSCGSG